MIEALPILATDSGAYAERSRSNPSLFDRLPRNDDEWLELARSTRPDPSLRERLWATLRPHWESLDLPESTRALLPSIAAEPTAAMVIAGQQPALAGGTLLHLSKALSAAVLAKRLRDRGQPACALLWVADEDHDVNELFGGYHPRGDGQLSVTNPFAHDRVMIDHRRLPDDGASLIDELRSLRVGEASWFPLLERTRSPSPSQWYRDFMLNVLAGYPLLPVHPSWIRSLQGEAFAEELAQPGRLRAEVALSCRTMEEHAVVPPILEAEEVPLFFVDDRGRRHRLESNGERFRLRGQADADLAPNGFDRAELIQLAEQDPKRFSPDALLRPLIQDRLFQPLAVITGPTEMAYQLELVESYRARAINRPVPFHRLRSRVLSEEQAAILQESGIGVERLTATVDWADLVPSPEAEAVRAELEERIGDLRGWLSSLADQERVTAALRKRLDRWARRLASDGEKLSTAIDREVAGGTEPTRRRLASVHRALWVKKLPAERVVSVLDYSRRFGAALLPALIEAYDPYDERERVVVIGQRADLGPATIAHRSESS